MMNLQDNRPYAPIACSLYDVLEAAAIRRQPLIITCGTKKRRFEIEDVFSKGSEEFLTGRDTHTNERTTIRLDEITTIVDPSVSKEYASDKC